MEAYSVGFAEADFRDELPLAQRMADRFGVHLNPVRPSMADLLTALPQTVWAADELMRDLANMPTLLLARGTAAQHKVVFSGEGGDEAFAGYRRYRPPALERLGKRALHPGSGGFRTSETVKGPLARRLYGGDLAEAARHTREPFVQAWQAAPAHWSDLQRRQYVDIVTALPDNLLVKADRMLMRHGVEGRVPFVDHRVVEFGLSLPDRLKVRDGQGKWFLKQWASRFLDRDLLFAPKQGFHVPFRSRFPAADLQRLQHLLPAQPGVREWFRADAVGRLLRDDARRGRLSQVALAILQFAQWHHMFVLGDGSAPPAGVGPVDLLEQGA
jgi:asparagine synthase (glutamine-hydrolysing)